MNGSSGAVEELSSGVQIAAGNVKRPGLSEFRASAPRGAG